MQHGHMPVMPRALWPRPRESTLSLSLYWRLAAWCSIRDWSMHLTQHDPVDEQDAERHPQQGQH